MNYAGKLELIHLLFDIAYADGSENPYELQVIQRISWNLGVSTLDFNSLKAPYTRTKDVNWAYTALEIQPSATDTEIKKAYREMAKKYHPDIFCRPPIWALQNEHRKNALRTNRLKRPPSFPGLHL